MNFEDIAQKIIDLGKPIVLIFAFNGTGKTQLSVAFKNLTKNSETNQHAGVYYNAFSEDLFVWENDDENNGENIRLRVLPSSLNKFHSFFIDNADLIMAKLKAYGPKFKFRLNAHENFEEGIESFSFFAEGKSPDSEPIKISRGEERIFVWCFFLALLEIDGWAKEHNAHIFIDDPVSSLDENNIFITANTLFEQIETHYMKKRIIITTHHIGLFSILSNRLTKGEKSSRYKEITGRRILKIVDGKLVLHDPGKKTFLYHLHLLEVLGEAIKNQLYTYHFVLLRQLLENIASFLGEERPGRVLQIIGKTNDDELMQLINTHSHKTPYYHQTELMSEAESVVFRDVFNALNSNYKFVF